MCKIELFLNLYKEFKFVKTIFNTIFKTIVNTIK